MAAPEVDLVSLAPFSRRVRPVWTMVYGYPLHLGDHALVGPIGPQAPSKSLALTFDC